LKKVAVYARVSTSLQVTEGSSLDVQIDLCEKKVNELGITKDGEILIFREEGVSGEDIERPALNRLRGEIASGVISHVIVTHPDRLSRDLTDKLYICREFEVHDIKLVFVDTDYQTTPEGLLFFNLMSVIAQYELSLIKKRTIRGRLRAVEKDKKIMPMRVAPFGYDLVEQSLVIIEVEAAIVRKIYDWYINDRLTLRQIGTRLYEMGVSPKRGESRNWGASSILRILNSEVYIGKYYYNRRRFKKVKGEKTKGGKPKKTYDFREEDEWLMVPVPPIVDHVVFMKARQQRINNTKKAGNIKYEYLLKSKIKCALCGRKWNATTYPGGHKGGMIRYTCYRCPNHFPKRYGEGVDSCPSKTIRGELLDNYVWDLVMEVLSDPSEYIAQLRATSEFVSDELREATAQLEKEIQQRDKEIEKVKTLFRHGVINEEEVVSEFRKLKKEKEGLLEDLKRYNDKLVASRGEELTAEKTLELTERVQEFIDQGGKQLTLDEKRFVVDTLIDEILIRYIENDVVLTILGHLGTLQGNNGQTGVILQRRFKLINVGYRNTKVIVPSEI
jgi:site-specific DNA recombinase